MAAPVIYRSTDSNAPILTANNGSLIALLDACLVNGLGSVKATATITSSGVNVSNNDTVTINGTVYTFKTALTPTAGEILIGASAAASLSNLCAAIGSWGTAGTTYATGTTTQTVLQATGLSATVITLTAFRGGTAGNAFTLAKSAATLTVSGATFTGGSGTDTTAGLGWGSPFTGTHKAVYRAAAGVRHYLDVDDSAPNTTALGRNAPMRGYEVMTAVGTGTNAFPTAAQVTTAVGIVKSSTLAVTARPWLLVGDDRTFYLFVASGTADPPVLASHRWTAAFYFGEILSALSGDIYRTIFAYQDTTVTAASPTLGAFTCANVSSSTAAVTTNMARTYTGAGGSLWVTLVSSQFFNSAGTDAVSGAFATFPHTVDGGAYLNAFDIYERGSGGTAVAANGSPGCRGRPRGIYQTPFTGVGVNDQDTFTGIGDFAGKSFMFLKTLNGMIAVETTAWAASS